MEPTPVYVSTGLLPPEERVRLLVGEAFERFRDVSEGELSRVYPALAEAAPDAFGISVVGSDGGVFEVGDADAEFTIMSVAKPFAFALVCAALGAEEVRERVGVNATGLPFNSLDAVERTRDGRTNPMVNPGAIATASLVPGAGYDDRWEFLRDGLSRFAGRALALHDEVYESASSTNHVNRAIASLLEARERISGDPD